MHWIKPSVAILVMSLLASCGREKRLFRELSPDKSGVEFTNKAEESDGLSILDYLYFYNGGGVALGDINDDGLPDIFFSSNQGDNKLYLNKGGLTFEDITERAGVSGKSSWNTGATMADVNGDGLLDIYVCAVVGLLGFDGHNELYINQGDGTFSEESARYGLDYDTFSSSAAFFDYDRDGDLDLYLLNHAVHTQESFGKASLRNERDYETGDRLLRNDGGRFTDVSEEAGLYGGINAYGLGLCISDFNRDGFPDIYVGNDFHEDDYYYLNQGDGTFRECMREFFGHTSRFSMGNDAADINGDGFPDLISLDMLPDREKVLKSSEGDDNIQVQRMRTQQYGYHYQFSRNMLYVNQPNGQFLETALMSGLAATDWSWTTLVSDYDQDGYQDIFVTNGIARRPNDLDFVRYVSNEQIQNKLDNTSLVDRKALDLMPEGAEANRIFKGTGSLVFLDKSSDWLGKEPSLSGAAAHADLDGDGDLDLVINNFNSPAQILINTTDQQGAYLKVRLKGPAKNTWGIGTQLTGYANDRLIYSELIPSRGFQSSNEPLIHLGLGSVNALDSIRIYWPDGTTQLLGQTAVNQTLILEYEPTRVRPSDPFLMAMRNPDSVPVRFEKDSLALGLDYTHQEDPYIHFNREPLIPFSVADRGPLLLTGDLDGDGQEDILLGGSKFIPARAFARRDSLFVPFELPEVIRRDSVKEWVSGTLADLHNEGKQALVLGAGGADFFGKSSSLVDNHFRKANAGNWTPAGMPEVHGNTSVIEPFDFDGDGDLDLFLGTQTLTGKFGLPASSYLLENSNGEYRILQSLEFTGMPTAASWIPATPEYPARLLVVGEWMPPRLFALNEANRLEEIPTDLPSGLWECIEPIDWDRDGDLDYAVGNWGLNTKFTASRRYPLRMYTADYDNNGTSESVVCSYREGSYFPIYAFDDLAKQLPYLRKKFPNYKDFAGQDMDGIFDREILKGAEVWEVEELRTGVLINQGGSFEFQEFPELLQVAPIMDMLALEADGDPGLELLAAGNYFGVKPYQGRFDSFPGALLDPEGNVISGSDLGFDWQQKSARELRHLEIQGQRYILVAFNDSKLEVYRLKRE